MASSLSASEYTKHFWGNIRRFTLSLCTFVLTDKADFPCSRSDLETLSPFGANLIKILVSACDIKQSSPIFSLSMGQQGEFLPG